jgi:hypothetical protein
MQQGRTTFAAKEPVIIVASRSSVPSKELTHEFAAFEKHQRSLTTGKNVCADGQKLRRRPNIGAVGVAPSHGSRANGPSG